MVDTVALYSLDAGFALSPQEAGLLLSRSAYQGIEGVEGYDLLAEELRRPSPRINARNGNDKRLTDYVGFVMKNEFDYVLGLWRSGRLQAAHERIYSEYGIQGLGRIMLRLSEFKQRETLASVTSIADYRGATD